jgi:hypothetical protein
MRLPRMVAHLCGFFVSLSILGCSSHQPRISADFNQGASLAGASAESLPVNPLRWKVITSEFNKKDSTMSTLYGNELAAGYARTNSQHDYPAGAALSLVTWTQREDGRWFGAKIPDQLRSVEFVTVEAGPDGRPLYSYQKYEGTPLKKLSADQGLTSSNRVAYLLSQRAAVLP